jgi:hypothetical protein
MVLVVSHHDLAAQGPEACRQYSWSFNECEMPDDRRVHEVRDNSAAGDRKEAAVLARYDHFIAKCAHFVERNRGVVREGAAAVYSGPVRKRQEDTERWRGLKDLLVVCDEKVARGEPGRRGLRWSDSHVFFHQPTAWNRPEQRAIPQAIDHLDVSVFVFAHEKLSLGYGRAYGPKDAVAWTDKDSWIGGVKHSCER